LATASWKACRRRIGPNRFRPGVPCPSSTRNAQWNERPRTLTKFLRAALHESPENHGLRLVPRRRAARAADRAAGLGALGQAVRASGRGRAVSVGARAGHRDRVVSAAASASLAGRHRRLHLVVAAGNPPAARRRRRSGVKRQESGGCR